MSSQQRTTGRRRALRGAAVVGVAATAALAVVAVAALSASGQTGAAGGAPSVPTVSQAMQEAQKLLPAHLSAVRGAADEQFVPTGALVDPDGSRHVRFDRVHDGVPVLGGDFTVHTDRTGGFRDATVGLAAPLAVSTTPRVRAKSAARTAANAAARVQKARHGDQTVRLVVDARGGVPALAWQVATPGVGVDGGPSSYQVLVDASTGKVRSRWESVPTFAARSATPTAGTAQGPAAQAADANGHGYLVGDVAVSSTQVSGGYELSDSTRGGGQTRDAQDQQPNGGSPPSGWGKAFTSSNNVWGDGTANNRASYAVDAAYGIQVTWDYYLNVLGRKGIDGRGTGSRSFVHYGSNYANAGWDDSCYCMIYGDGDGGTHPFTEIDVAGHEMSHGVMSATAGLNYSGESGGLNEANSDIFGTLVEFYANNPADQPDYLMGEKIDINGNGTPLRWMDDPSKDGRSASCWSWNVGNLDVHYSSGVANHWFYLLAVGSGETQWGNSPTCNSAPAVTGVGNDKAGKIWYRAISAGYMNSNTNFAGARTASLKAAKDLYPGDVCKTVDAAWKAVNVTGSAFDCGSGSGDPTPTPTGTPSPTPTGTPSPTPTDTPPNGGTVTVTNPGYQAGFSGFAIFPVQLRATASDGGALIYSATGLPAGLSISSSGQITGTPTAGGTSTVTVTAKEANGTKGSTSFEWQIWSW